MSSENNKEAPLPRFSFRGLVNVDQLQNMLEVNYAATGMPSGIIDAVTGEVYAGAGWQDICVKFHRAHPTTNALCIENDTAIVNKIKDGKPHGYRCANGLWDIGVPIYCAGHHVATSFLGQFYYEDEFVDEKFFIRQAEKYGFDQQAYLEALRKVPRFSREKVEEILKHNVALSAFLSDMATQNYKYQQEIVQREQIEDELRHLRNYLSNIIDSMPSILIGVDTEGLVTQWNIMAEKESGLSSAEAVGRSLSEVMPRLAEDMDRVREAVESRREMVDPKRRSRIGGSTRYEDITIYPLVINGVEGAVVRIDDVTSRVNLEQMMVQSEKMMSVGGLAAGMAHEINNPLAAIMGYGHNVKKRIFGSLTRNVKVAEACGVSLEGVREYLKRREIPMMLEGILESGERASNIVSNMLRFSRKSEKHMGKYDLAELLDKTLELAANDYSLKKQYDFRKIEIVRDYEPDMPKVHCEGNEIQQVFLNLFKNGAEAMANKDYGDEGPRLRLSLKRRGGLAVVEVEDNGPGLDEYTRKRVFEPFFTTKEVDKGIGLGLSVSYFIVADQHKGRMEVHSEMGQWTRFTVMLPITDEEA